MQEKNGNNIVTAVENTKASDSGLHGFWLHLYAGRAPCNHDANRLESLYFYYHLTPSMQPCILLVLVMIARLMHMRSPWSDTVYR